MRAAFLLVLVVAPLAAGCTLTPPKQPLEVRGSVDGYDPTSAFLKVHVTSGDQVILVDFDRRDWNADGIAKMIDQGSVRNLTVHGMPREIMDEVLVDTVGAPSALANQRWNDQTTPAQRDAADRAYDALVARAHPPSGNVSSHVDPTLPIAPSLGAPASPG